jgi:putative ABC transport system permease protein
MFWLAFRELVSRRLATALAAAGLVTAALGFTALASAAQTTQVALSGDISRAWQTPYDLLVRPAGWVDALESQQGLIRTNYVSGLHGGITPAQLASIWRIAGVQVAAPLAVAGYVNWQGGQFSVDLDHYPRTGALTVFRVTTTTHAEANLSTYPVETQFVVVASEGTLITDPSTIDRELHVQGTVITCNYPVSCWAPTMCFGTHCSPADYTPLYGLPILQPIVIAGVDPQAESALAGLDHCLTSGRYLTPTDTPQDGDQDPPGPTIPALVSARSFVDETFSADVAQGDGTAALLAGASPEQLTSWRQLGTATKDANTLYREFLPRIGQDPDDWPIWSVGDVSYHEHGRDTLAVRAVAADLSIYQRPYFRERGYPESLFIPPEARDTWFRSVQQHLPLQGDGARYWEPVGTYDPQCLRGFDPLAGGGGLESYSVPQVQLANGHTLGPTRSFADYVNSPPLVLTTLASAAWFAEARRFEGQPGQAYISVIRVKVSGVESPSALAEGRLARIAADIHDATGLQVDVVKGASPKAITVALPSGQFGRPPLTLTEYWFVKGVTARFVQALSAQNLALLSLMVLGATLMVGQTAFLSVRRRQAEFGVLRALGWSPWRIAWLVEGEMLLLGLAVGALTVLVGGALVTAGTLRLSYQSLLLAMLVAVASAALAAIAPALSAARGTTRSIMSGVGARRTIRHSRAPRSALTLGVRELFGPWRLEACLGVGAVALGSALLGGVVLVASAFNGQLDTTVLGTYLGVHVQSFHIILGVLTVIVGTLAAGEVITLGYLERRLHYATLRALGWPRRQIVGLLLTQALVLGMGGGLLGAVVVGAVGLAFNAGIPALVVGVGAGWGVALAATSLAAIAPVILAYRLKSADALRGE